jgi:hypothetical protein
MGSRASSTIEPVSGMVSDDGDCPSRRGGSVGAPAAADPPSETSSADVVALGWLDPKRRRRLEAANELEHYRDVVCLAEVLADAYVEEREARDIYAFTAAREKAREALMMLVELIRKDAVRR